MIRIAVCDDDELELNSTIKMLKEYNREFFEIDAFTCGENLLLSKRIYEIILLDIDMQGIDGIETAKSIRNKDRNVKIIYITNYSDYMTFAFAVHAFAYLLKPLKKEDLFAQLDEAFFYGTQRVDQVIEFQTTEGIMRMKCSEILYFEYQDRKVLLHAKDAAQYAGSIHEMLNGLGQKYYTSNKILNIILNDKAHLMSHSGIREDIRVGDVNLAFMDDVDVTTLFANLLDNAIASGRQSEKPFIKLRVNAVRGFISLVMENSCKDEPEQRGNSFRSKRKDREGIGLKNIARTVELYNGDLQCTWKDGIFHTEIMLTEREVREC